MSIETLDSYFPMLIFTYGAIMTLTLNWPQLLKIAEERFPEDLLKQMLGHRYLALFSLIFGGLWTLQNIWLS
ncbi:MAG: hypothetical protein KDD61_08230 [Bdellovibrionales bacterium]|nr:hypothetical protein [Bdellovibrionales bacterium]